MSQALQAIKGILFFLDLGTNGRPLVLNPDGRRKLACQQIDSEPYDDSLEELRHLYFEETEGEWNIKEEPTTEGVHLLPLKTKKLNIGTKEKPKLATVWDY